MGDALLRYSGGGKLSRMLCDLIFSGKMNNLLLVCLAVAEEASRGQQSGGGKEPKQQQQRRRRATRWLRPHEPHV